MYKKVARQRQDDARKWAKKIVRDHDAVAVEDFHPKFLARSTMARKAADAAIGDAKKALIEMGRKHGRDIHLVDPAHTTMDCGQCGVRAKHRLPLSERIYTCTACGMSRPRDKNSAYVMLVRAGLAPGGADGARPLRPVRAGGGLSRESSHISCREGLQESPPFGERSIQVRWLGFQPSSGFSRFAPPHRSLGFSLGEAQTAL
ncbi:hypothetical protein GCM10022254_53430 [Actinomadura meridiana]|uniref:Cas12f1-like TNB domain-containing protein n=1 Tax=Actinomadura meridiana TaxID=559626 RepID=A0ABP8CEU2_9ACTN